MILLLELPERAVILLRFRLVDYIQRFLGLLLCGVVDAVQGLAEQRRNGQIQRLPHASALFAIAVSIVFVCIFCVNCIKSAHRLLLNTMSYPNNNSLE